MKDNTPKPVGAILAGLQIAKAKPKRSRSRLQQRLTDTAVMDDSQSILYQHSVLCQTCLPYRDPGDEVREWERSNGKVRLLLTAGKAYRSSVGRFIEVGLPFGPKPRLVLYHLNTEALRTQSPVIELEDSLTAFVKHTLRLDTGGRTLNPIKEQLGRLSASDFRFGTNLDGHDVTVKGTIVDGFELWTPRDAQQRVLWPTTVRFSERYFADLMKHAIPLSEIAIGALAHSSMALDVYTWLAQRLHRIEEGKPAFVRWVSLSDQFGQGYERIRDFRRVFVRTLKQVKTVYPEAQFSLTAGGMNLRHSRPPISKRLVTKSP